MVAIAINTQYTYGRYLIFRVLRTPNMVLGTPDMVLGTPYRVLGTPDMVLGTPDMVLGTPDIVLGTPDIVLGTQYKMLGQGTSRFLAKGGGGAFWSQGGASRFFLQITWFFSNAVLLLYLKLFICLEIITMLKLSFEMFNDVILSCNAQVTISQEVAKWLKKPAQGENFKISFLMY